MLRSLRRPLILALILAFNCKLVVAEVHLFSAKNEVYAGYSYLSSSFNAYANFSGSGMSGWDAALAMPAFGGLSVKAAALGYYGTNLGASQHEHSFFVGPQYSIRFRKESVFAHGLVGLAHINDAAIPYDNSKPSSNFTFASMAGGGLDTRIAPHFAWRIEGDYLRSQFGSSSDQIHGLHGNFARVATGLVFRF